ncbi:MAG: histidine kinase dimerization/phosphoacceptor domain-containing protein, partial [Acidimicrobiales bacterium]
MKAGLDVGLRLRGAARALRLPGPEAGPAGTDVRPSRVAGNPPRGHLLRSPAMGDVVLALALCGVGWPALWAGERPGVTPVGLVAVVLALAQGLPVAFRRRWPFPVLIVVSAAATAYGALGFPTTALGAAGLVVLATVAINRSGFRSSLGLVVAVASVAVIALARVEEPPAVVVVANAVVVVAAWAAGTGIRLRRDRVAALEERAEAAEELAAERARRHMDEERLAMAAAVHDTIGHSLAAVLRQAEAAERTDGPGRDELLERITARVRATLSELGRTVVLLSRDGPSRA